MIPIPEFDKKVTDDMSPIPSAVNALLREIKQAVDSHPMLPSHNKDVIIDRIASEKDVEVHTAFKMLIEAVIEEK